MALVTTPSPAPVTSPGSCHDHDRGAGAAPARMDLRARPPYHRVMRSVLLPLLLIASCDEPVQRERADASADRSRPTGELGPAPDGARADAGRRDATSRDQARPADQAKDPCVALTAEPYENNEGNDAEFTAKFFPTADRDNEYIDMFFRSGALGTHAYGVGVNADLYTCEQCLLIVRNKKNFYPTAGTITIAAGSQPMKKTLFATLSKLTLVEITISPSYHSIPVAGGECVTLAPATINVP